MSVGVEQVMQAQRYYITKMERWLLYAMIALAVETGALVGAVYALFRLTGGCG